MKAKKSLSQNFLTNKPVACGVVGAAGVSERDEILEIGPGKGVLTEILLSTAKKVVAIEKDLELVRYLETKFEKEISEEQLMLIRGDAVDTKTIETALENFSGEYRLVANIPYAVTGQIFRIYLGMERQPKSMGLLVQKEVVERIIARDGKESILSISVKAYGTPRYICTVKRGSFSPAPKVDSAILAIENISKDFFKEIDEERFFETVRTGFRHKRKFVKKNLREAFPDRNLFLDHIPDKARAENLLLEDWKKI